MAARKEAYGTVLRASPRMASSRLDSILRWAVRTFWRTFRLTVLEKASVRVGKRMRANLRTSSLQSSRSSTRLSLVVFRALAGPTDEGVMGSPGFMSTKSPEDESAFLGRLGRS